MMIKKLGTQEIVSHRVQEAKSFSKRLIGLMFIAEMPQGYDSILLDPCNSIHTFFMKFPLDIVFLGRNNEVIKIFRNLPPNRMTWMYLKASKTLEMKAGTLPVWVQEGMKLEVVYA